MSWALWNYKTPIGWLSSQNSYVGHRYGWLWYTFGGIMTMYIVSSYHGLQGIILDSHTHTLKEPQVGSPKMISSHGMENYWRKVTLELLLASMPSKL